MTAIPKAAMAINPIDATRIGFSVFVEDGVGVNDGCEVPMVGNDG